MTRYQQPPARRRRSNGGLLGCSCVSSVLGCLGGLLLVMLACVVGVFFLSANAPDAPIPAYTPNPAEAQAFEDKISTASNQAANGGNFTLTVTQQEVSSWLNLRASDVAQEQIPVENMQVRFENGQAALYGDVQTSLVPIGAEVGFDLSIDPNGQLAVNVATVNVGGFDMPASVSDRLNQEIRTVIEDQIADIAESNAYVLQELTIQNGLLTVQGRVQ